MAWWWWVLIWVALVLGAVAVLALIGLSLWRRGVELARELTQAAERFALISEHLERLNPPPAQPAVFDDVARLQQERDKALRLARARNSLRMRQRAELRPQFPGLARPGSHSEPQDPVAGQRVR